MTAPRTAALMDDLAVVLAEAPMPADPFEAADVMAACKHLGAELVAFATRVRAERVANAAAWAVWEAELDKGTKPPPPSPPSNPPPTEPAAPPADDPPPSEPPSDRGRVQ